MNRGTGKLIAAGLFLIIFVTSLYFTVLRSAPEQIAEDDHEVETAIVSRNDIVDTIQFRGMIVVEKRPSVFSPSSAQGESVPEGKHPGDLLTSPATGAGEERLEIHVRELDLAVLEVGKGVAFWMDESSDKRYRGKIARIETAVSRDRNVTLFRVLIDILGKKPDFRPGIHATVEVVAGDVTGVLSVPAEAVFRRGPQAWVYVDAEEGPVRKDVGTGLSNIDLIEISTGLDEGERVFLEEPPEI